MIESVVDSQGVELATFVSLLKNSTNHEVLPAPAGFVVFVTFTVVLLVDTDTPDDESAGIGTVTGPYWMEPPVHVVVPVKNVNLTLPFILEPPADVTVAVSLGNQSCAEVVPDVSVTVKHSLVRPSMASGTPLVFESNSARQQYPPATVIVAAAESIG